MDLEFLEKILNLFESCQSRGKALEINIDEDLLKILPLPRKLLLDLLSDQSISTFFHLSNDQKTLYFQNNLRLCSIDENEGGSCQSSSCEQLHLCKTNLLNNNCSQFKFSGKCSHSHSLSTNHNEKILQKFNLSSKDPQIFSFLSRLIKLSSTNQSKLIVQTRNQQKISDNLINQWLDPHKTLLKDQKLINSNTIEFVFDDDEVASMMEDLLIQHHSTTALIIKTNPSSDLIEKQLDKDMQLIDQRKKSSIENPLNLTFGRGRGRQPMNNQSTQNSFSRRLGSNVPINEKKISFSHRLNSTSNEHLSQYKEKSHDNSLNSTPELINNETNQVSQSESFSSYFLPKVEEKRTNSPSSNDHKEMISPENLNSNPRFVLRGHSIKNKDKNPNQTFINYIYNKPFLDKHLSYLLGPGKRHIIEKDQCQILSYLSFGYCRVKTIEQGKEIEKQLYAILPEKLNIESIKIPNDLALIICSSAAEHIFQQSQTHYAIVSEPTTIQLNIEVIHAPAIEHNRSSTRNNASSSIHHKTTEQSLSNGKFHINTTNSSINVISGDISQTPIDMMICISTSNNLRDSILRRAGSTIASQYENRSSPTDALLLDGGLTSARKILFVPWQTEIEEIETTKTQKSLSDLVKWCIEQAHQRNMKSISFPPIGTGQLGLDPAFVCEAMISAASECLHQYQIDVLFVIYPSNDIHHEDQDECYQVFRIYLDSLSEQMKSTKDSRSSMMNNNEIKRELIKRNVQSERLLTLSDSANVNQDHQLLRKSLEDLIYEKTFDFSLIEPSLIDQIDLLIDICLKCNVYPRVDYSREELTLRGDRDSCSQCFFNLRQGKKVHQYRYVLTENGEKSDEKLLNLYISLQIDQAFALGESNICIKDNDQMIYNIDLNKLQVRLNKDKQSAFLVKKQLNHSEIDIPSSWSSPLLMIRTIEIRKSSFESLDCFILFQETMSTNDWQIERIDSIENYPLFIHFMNNRREKSQLYFHACSYSSVQSIIHYGLHSTNASNYGDQFDNSSICLTRHVFNSHLYGSRRATDGKYYIFAVEIAKNDNNNDLIVLSNEDTYLALPTYLIVYQRRNSFH